MWGISIHSLRMEGDGAITTPGYVGDISIHSLRMEGDSRHCACGRSQLHFNPLPPHGGRLPFSNRRFTDSTFQSTPSAWRETVSLMDSARPSRDFNPLPPHGGRPVCMMLFTAKKRISIHSLRMEGDASSSDARSRCFISIHSLRMEGDLVKKYNYSEYNISIHSLRMEGDFVTLFYFHLCTSHFNPLPPHGGRHGLPF